LGLKLAELDRNLLPYLLGCRVGIATARPAGRGRISIIEQIDC
jgi:hypothetical protein